MASGEGTPQRKPVWLRRRDTIGWVFYDWANSAFVLSVTTAFFPVLFKKFFCAGHEASFSTIRLNLANALVGLCIAVLAPVMGALADAGRSRKRFLLIFMLTGVSMASLLAGVGEGAWLMALAFFVVGNIGFSCANLFYDSLLPEVAPPEHFDMVSSVGYSIGYLGCGLLFLVHLWMVKSPETFGLADKLAATRVVFVTVAVWWALFSIPLLVFVRERGAAAKRSAWQTVRKSLVQLRATFRDITGHRALWLFLLAYWLYIDGVHTFIRAAVDLGLSIGLDDTGLMISLAVVQFTAFPSAYAFGRIARRRGAVPTLLAGIGIYLFIVAVGPLAVSTPLQFGLFAALSAIPLGALQALSRSYFARMVPPDRSAEFFGFYSLMGKFAVMLGPAVIAGVTALSRAQGADSATAARFGCTALSVFFVAGGILLVLADRQRKADEAAGAIASN